MISKLFFYGKIKDVENRLMYEEEFVLFYLRLQLKENDIFTKEKIETLLEKLYGKEKIKNNRILEFCGQYFESKEKNFSLTIPEEEKEFYKKTKELKKDLEELITSENDKLHRILEKEISDPHINFWDKLKKCMVYYYANRPLKTEEITILVYQYFFIIKNYYKLYRKIDLKLEEIPELFNGIEITDLNLTEQQCRILMLNNVFTLKNLKHRSIDFLICIFCENIESFIEKISQYAISKKEILNKLNQKFEKIIKPEWDRVLQKRYQFQTNQKESLTDIGKELNLTKERIRQIEIKAIEKLRKQSNEMNQLLVCFYKEINKEKKNFITIDSFCDYIQDEKLTRNLIILLSISSTDLTLNEEYGIIYNNQEITMEEIRKEAEEKLENIIVKTEIESYDIVQKNIIKNNYKQYQDKIFVKKEFNISYLYMNELKENFVDGYDAGSKQDYERLVKRVKEKYGEIEVSSMHSIKSMIDRNDFVQIDRGRYKSRKYAINLSEKLVNQILHFIIKNAPVVTYSVIFEKFKKELEEIGINNRFYLKGCIDEKLPEEFNTKRDYINTNSKENHTTFDIAQKVFQTFDGAFTIEDVKEKMPGLKEYNYENYARTEEENGLIQIAPKTYIYIDKLQIREETKKELKEYIDELFEKMDSKLLTSKKIYASLSIMKKELLEQLHITSKFGDFELFSIIQHLYKEEYFYSRPIISKEQNFITSSYLVVKEYAKKQKLFSYTDIKQYLYKMNLGGILSYLNFMDNLSDEYVQISKDSMIRKEELNLKQEQLEKIEELMELLLKNRELKTEHFDGYFMLPKLNRSWNKYLLIGIIKTYFKEKYEVENTTNFYDTTDYIIRRAN
ncbi:MAG: hypothetical protein HFJ33_06475 [Clostridia bacterium]|nr:hypothetical protein [Clostridia bacterium]